MSVHCFSITFTCTNPEYSTTRSLLENGNRVFSRRNGVCCSLTMLTDLEEPVSHLFHFICFLSCLPSINPNLVQILKTCLEYMGPNILKFLISQNIFADLKGPKEKYKLHFGRCTVPLFRAATQHNSLYINFVFIPVGLEPWLLWQLIVPIDLKWESGN